MASAAVVKMEVEDGVKTNGEETVKTEIVNTETVKLEGKQTEEKKTEDVKKGAAASAANQAHFRVKISGLPRFYTPNDPLLMDFKKLLNEELKLEFKYIRSPKKGNSWLYITFYDQENQERALKMLKHYVWKGRTLICTLVVADVLKRKQEDLGQVEAKRPRLDIPIEEQMLMATIPYHSVGYEEQLSKKDEEAEHLFKWLAECMEKKTPELIGYIDQEVAKNPETKLPFKLDKVRASPMIDGYRNKCEFRIGTNPETKKVVVGYRVDNQEDDNIAVAPPDSLRHLPKEMIEVVKVFEKFVQESEYPPQVVNHDAGVWRLLHVRINKKKEIMVVVLINPSTVEESKLKELKIQLVQYFTKGSGSNKGIVSLYLHMDSDLKISTGALGGDKLKRPSGKLEHLWGATHIEEQLLDLNLEIDPNFYFQNNTYGAEELYKAVMELADVDSETTVLDLCCGSGGMGMMFAKHCKEVIGVELMDVNVEDAKRLAAKNGLTNCEFLQGAVDDLIPQLEEKLKNKKVVPLLDPPRTGISTKLILSLRKMAEAHRILYVCSNHKLPSKNIMDMSLLEGEGQIYKDTSPFFPTRIIPVDISPHSLRCELVLCLERVNMKTVPKPTRTSKPRIKTVYYNTGRGNRERARGRGVRGTRGAGFRGVMGVRGMRGLGSRGVVAPRRGMGMRGLRGMMSVGMRGRGGMQARDSLYPAPLRGNLYQNGQRGYGPPQDYDYDDYPLPPMRPKPYDRGYEYSLPTQPTSFGPRRGVADRYSNFRRDVEDAIDSSYPPEPRSRAPVSSRLAMANAMLEQGLRLAEEAMAENYRPPTSPAAEYLRRGGSRGSYNPLPAARPAPRPVPRMRDEWSTQPRDTQNTWCNDWYGDDYRIIAPPKAVRSRGVSRASGRGTRGFAHGHRGARGSNSNTWRR